MLSISKSKGAKVPNVGSPNSQCIGGLFSRREFSHSLGRKLPSAQYPESCEGLIMGDQGELVAMKSTQSHIRVALSALGICAYWCVSTGVVEESAGMAIAIAEQVAELERSWHPGTASKEYEYYVRAGEIGRNLFRHEPNAANAAALELLNNLLAKRVRSSEVRDADFDLGEADLLAMATVARFLLAEGNVPIGRQEQKLEPFAKLLGLVRAEIVPDYVPKRVTMNVTPPLGGVSGMDPEAIADPIARDQYKAAIRDNQLNNLMNKRQRALQAMETEFASRIVAYMSHIAGSDKVSPDTIRRAIDDARLTEPERAEMVRAVRH